MEIVCVKEVKLRKKQVVCAKMLIQTSINETLF